MNHHAVLSACLPADIEAVATTPRLGQITIYPQFIKLSLCLVHENLSVCPSVRMPYDFELILLIVRSNDRYIIPVPIGISSSLSPTPAATSQKKETSTLTTALEYISRGQYITMIRR